MPIIKNKGFVQKATSKQQDYIHVLSIDCGMTDEQRRSFIELRTGHRFLDEISMSQATSIIDELKQLKEKRSEFH